MTEPSDLAAPPTRELLTAEEAADRLKVAERSIRRWIRERRIPVVRLGRAVRIRDDVLNRIIDAGGFK